MSKNPVENGLEQSDPGALSETQRKDLRQLKVDTQKTDETYIRVKFNIFLLIFDLSLHCPRTRRGGVTKVPLGLYIISYNYVAIISIRL